MMGDYLVGSPSLGQGVGDGDFGAWHVMSGAVGNAEMKGGSWSLVSVLPALPKLECGSLWTHRD